MYIAQNFFIKTDQRFFRKEILNMNWEFLDHTNTEGECVKREECQYSTSLSLIENHFQERQDKRRPYSPHFGIPKSF